MFLPLWAGVPLPPDQVKAIVEKHMLNPHEFFRELPFPSLSYDNPKYDPTGYWRGRIWPHVVYWMIQTLWREGYRREAEQFADRLLKMLQKTPFLHENYESAGGGGIGCPDYNWSRRWPSNCCWNATRSPCPRIPFFISFSASIIPAGNVQSFGRTGISTCVSQSVQTIGGSPFGTK